MCMKGWQAHGLRGLKCMAGELWRELLRLRTLIWRVQGGDLGSSSAVSTAERPDWGCFALGTCCEH